MINIIASIVDEESSKSIPTDSLAIIISLIALIVSVVGWGAVHLLNIKATNVDRKNNFQLNIYQNLLDKTNGLIKIISSYTTSAISHTNAMAKILKEYHSYDHLSDSQAKIDSKYNLQITWLDTSYKIAEQSFEMQKAIEDYMRYLDMNGTDHTKGTPVYDSLLEIKTDAYEAADRNRKRWSDHKEMDKLTPKSYDKISNETKTDADIIFEFGMCIDDVLTLVYNESISGVLRKPSKQIDRSDVRRIITKEGILDNRKSNLNSRRRKK